VDIYKWCIAGDDEAAWSSKDNAQIKIIIERTRSADEPYEAPTAPNLNFFANLCSAPTDRSDHKQILESEDPEKFVVESWYPFDCAFFPIDYDGKIVPTSGYLFPNKKDMVMTALCTNKRVHGDSDIGGDGFKMRQLCLPLNNLKLQTGSHDPIKNCDETCKIVRQIIKGFQTYVEYPDLGFPALECIGFEKLVRALQFGFLFFQNHLVAGDHSEPYNWQRLRQIFSSTSSGRLSYAEYSALLTNWPIHNPYLTKPILADVDPRPGPSTSIPEHTPAGSAVQGADLINILAITAAGERDERPAPTTPTRARNTDQTLLSEASPSPAPTPPANRAVNSDQFYPKCTNF
jgi:hypothetical protein